MEKWLSDALKNAVKTLKEDAHASDDMITAYALCLVTGDGRTCAFAVTLDEDEAGELAEACVEALDTLKAPGDWEVHVEEMELSLDSDGDLDDDDVDEVPGEEG